MIINIIIRIMPSGEELGIELPDTTLGSEIVAELSNGNYIPKYDADGNASQYELIVNRNTQKIDLNISVRGSGVQEGDLIFLVPKLSVSSRTHLTAEEIGKLKRITASSNDQYVDVVIRTMPQGVDYAMGIPEEFTAESVIEQAIDAEIIPKFDREGYNYVYDLISCKSGKRIDNASGIKRGVEYGEIFYLVPKLVAGGGGLMTYDIPTIMTAGYKNRCVVRISGSDLKRQLLRKGLNDESKTAKVEIGKLMSVSLSEYALHESLVINSLTDREQTITEGHYTEWIFDVIPNKKGFTSLLLKVSILEFIESFGQKSKNVFTIDINIEITDTDRKPDNSTRWVHDMDDFVGWTSFTKQTIIQHISSNDTGKALSTLANYAQTADADLYNSIILLQAQYNEGRNKSMLNLIEQTQWWMLQSRINYAVLEMTKDIENGVFSSANNLSRIQTTQSYMTEQIA